MMMRNGVIHRVLTPGLHWRWWFIERKIEWPTSEVVLSLPTCSVTTSDGRAIAVDANFGYCLIDIALSWRRIWNMEMSLKAAAAGILCSELAQRTWVDLQGDARKAREEEIRVALDTFGRTVGLTIPRLHLVACVEARQHRHFVDGALTR